MRRTGRNLAREDLNNRDRHEQSWGFLMENISGKIIGYCPLFDHDHTFGNYQKSIIMG